MLKLFGGRASNKLPTAGTSDRVFPIMDSDAYYVAEAEVPGSPLNGLCPVCGEHSSFVDFTENVRESGACSTCGASNRQRQVAFAVRRQTRRAFAGPLSEFGSAFGIYNTESTGPFHVILSRNQGYVCSEYFGSEYRGGDLVNGVRHEDLQSLSFADGAFDLVLSSDVMEHMPEPYRAHAEIFRVLKPGGRHIFTVPFYPWEARDEVRARLVDGEIQYFGEKLYHGDPVRPGEGILVWTIFGLEMLVRLAEIGFKPSVWRYDEPTHGIIGPGAIVFEALKPV